MLKLSVFHQKPCRRCGKPFKPVGANSRWCSEACQRGTSKCRHCEKLFVPTKKSAGLFCSKKCFYEFRCPVGSTFVTTQGYVVEKVPEGTPGKTIVTGTQAPGRWMFQHRHVMQQKLGRPLQDSETVHHKNANKQDNAPDNLELWNGKSHPKGVKAGDYHCPGCRCFD